MSQVRCVYRGQRPTFPPDAGVSRYGPITLPDGSIAYVDVVGAQPSVDEIVAQMGIASSKHLDQHLTTAIAEFSPKETAMSETDQAATPLPAAPVLVTPKPVVPAKGSFAASLRAVMDEARAGVAQAKADGLAQVTAAVAELHDAKEATKRVAGNMVKAIKDEAADIKAELGQISNDL